MTPENTSVSSQNMKANFLRAPKEKMVIKKLC